MAQRLERLPDTDAMSAPPPKVRTSDASKQPNGLRNSPMARSFAFTMILCSILTLSVNYLHPYHSDVLHPDHHAHNLKSAVSRSMKDFTELHAHLKELKEKESAKKKKSGTIEQVLQPNQALDKQEYSKILDSARPPLATLQCDAYGGPSPEIAREMVYWSDIPSDSSYKSPFHAKRGQHKRYMTFEPDGGGWNNIRMAMETVFALCHAMGRTLVMPPSQRMYLLVKGDNEQKKHFGFADFFPIDEMANEHQGLEIISMQEFLEREAMTGNLLEKSTGKPSFPPHNRTDWNGRAVPEIKLLKEWLRNVTHVAMWRPMQCLAAFPASAGQHEDIMALKGMVANGGARPDRRRPVPVDAPPQQRMQHILSGRSELCIYDEEMQNEMVVHFMCDHKMRIRLLVHFYQFLFFEDWRQDLWTKRFIRDHVRYIDEIQCAAARVVHAIRERVKTREGDSGNGDFDSFQVRRGDFQYKATRISAQEIYANSKSELKENGTVYIATDEKNRTFFQPLMEHYDVVFLNDFQKEIKGLNTNYYGMLDQLVASRGRVFFGCWFSTFTGYITRMRGYHADHFKLPGYQDGLLPNTYYYTLKENKHAMMTYDFWATFVREYPISWREIDRGIGLLPTCANTTAEATATE